MICQKLYNQNVVNGLNWLKLCELKSTHVITLLYLMFYDKPVCPVLQGKFNLQDQLCLKPYKNSQLLQLPRLINNFKTLR